MSEEVDIVIGERGKGNLLEISLSSVRFRTEAAVPFLLVTAEREG